MILITGSEGLIGRGLSHGLTRQNVGWRGFDIRSSDVQDTRDRYAIRKALDGVTGVVHLAAVSRVVWAQNDPELTQSVNVDALKTLIECLAQSPATPWLIFASSREVYGEQQDLPVAEDAELRPLNVYARSKVAGEELTKAARDIGIRSQIIRFSNVYGSINDHSDRVTPAFARAAASGTSIRVDGGTNTFDFTHVDDAVCGLHLAVDATRSGENLPPLHFLTGRGTTLHELAELAQIHSPHTLKVRDAPQRNYDVSRFYGDRSRAKELLGWSARVPLEIGFKRLVDDFSATSGIAEVNANANAHGVLTE